jgi:cytochrome c5
MLALVLALTLSAPPSARLVYERKCLYCHSEEVTEARKYTEPQWRRLIEVMRQKSPLLITRGDVGTLSRYMTQTLKLVIASPTPAAPARLQPTPPIGPQPPNPNVLKVPDLAPFPDGTPPLVTADPEEPSAAEVALEQQATSLIQVRCSKCHTLGRVYGRLDTYERSVATLERMRLKTGSGITDDEMVVLESYLRSQFGPAQER